MLSGSWDCVWLLSGKILCWTDESITCGGMFGVCINPWRPYDARDHIISSDHGLSHDHRRALIWTNPDKSLIGPLETNPKEKQNNFQAMKWIWKHRLQTSQLRSSSLSRSSVAPNQAITGSHDGLSPNQRQPITWTNAGNDRFLEAMLVKF